MTTKTLILQLQPHTPLCVTGNSACVCTVCFNFHQKCRSDDSFTGSVFVASGKAFVGAHTLFSCLCLSLTLTHTHHLSVITCRRSPYTQYTLQSPNLCTKGTLSLWRGLPFDKPRAHTLFLSLSLSLSLSNTHTQWQRLVSRGLNIGNLFFAVTQMSHRQKAVRRHTVSKGTHKLCRPAADRWMTARERESVCVCVCACVCVCVRVCRRLRWAAVTSVREMSHTHNNLGQVREFACYLLHIIVEEMFVLILKCLLVMKRCNRWVCVFV